jgi:hypothetical protein
MDTHRVRWKAVLHEHAEPRGRVHSAPLVGERVEAELASPLTIAGVSYTTERNAIDLGNMLIQS